MYDRIILSSVKIAVRHDYIGKVIISIELTVKQKLILQARIRI